MKALINIGNTHTQIAYPNDKFRIDTVQTKDFSIKQLQQVSDVAICAVVPEKLKFIRKSIKNAFVLTPKSNLNFSTEFDISTLGGDRIANLYRIAHLAKLNKLKLPAICIDFGTAITFEVLDENYVFKGGAILPGRRLLRQALNAKTAQLPLIDMDLNITSYLGKNTAESMGIGIDLGCVGAINSILEGIKLELKTNSVHIIGIGGDINFFTNHIKELKTESENFTLKGLLNAWEVNIES